MVFDFHALVQKKKLSFVYKSLSNEECIECANELMRPYAKVETLVLNGCECGPTGAQALALAIQVRQIKYLDLFQNPLGDQGVKEIAASLPKLKNLKTLDLRNVGMSDEGASALVEGIQGNVSIEEIMIGNHRPARNKNTADKAYQKQLISLVKPDARAARLHAIESKRIHDEHQGDLPKGENIAENREVSQESVQSGSSGLIRFDFNRLVQQRKLSINKRLSDDEFKALSNELMQPVAKVEKLDLGQTGCGLVGASVLGKAIQVRQITHLDMFRNPLGDEGVKQLAAALPKLRKLKVLQLQNVGMSDNGANALAEGLARNVSVSKVVVTNVWGAFSKNTFNKAYVMHFNTLVTREARARRSYELERQRVEGHEPNLNIIPSENLDSERMSDSNEANTMSIEKGLETLNSSPLTEELVERTSEAISSSSKPHEGNESARNNEERKGIPSETVEKEARLHQATVDRIQANQDEVLSLNGSRIESVEELEVALEHLRRRETFLLEDLSDSAIQESSSISESISELEFVRDQKLLLPSISELETSLTSLDSDTLTTVEGINSVILELRTQPGKVEEVRDLLQQRKSYEKKQEAERQRTLSNIEAAKKSLLKRQGVHQPSSATSMGPNCTFDFGRRLKEALEAASLQEPVLVDIDYVCSITNNWRSVLGEGAHGRVYKGYDRQVNKTFAIKQQSLVGPEFYKEIQALSKLDHDNIVRVLGHCSDIRLNTGYLIYEFAAGGSLDILLDPRKSGDEDRARYKWQRRCRTILQIAHALRFCHLHGVKHRDVKPGNVCFMLEDYRQAMLIDFGISTETQGTQSWGGTPAYMAPEYKNPTGARKPEYLESTEAYSFGVLIITIVTSVTDPDELENLKIDVSRNESELVSRADPSAGCWDNSLLKCISRIAHVCLLPNPRNRYSFDNIVNILSSFKDEMSTILSNAVNENCRGSLCVVCGCKICFTCAEGHSYCITCLESKVEAQIMCEFIRCTKDGCQAELSFDQLKSVVDKDLLLDFSRERQRLEVRNQRVQQNSIRTCLDGLENLVADLSKEVAQKKDMAGVFSGIAFAVGKKSDCPSLCVLVPVECARFSYRRPFCQMYHLHFLCAYDHSPSDTCIEIRRSRRWVQLVMPALTYSVWALKLIAAVTGAPLPLPVPGITNSERLEKAMEYLADVDTEAFEEQMDALAQINESHLTEQGIQKMLCQARSRHVNASIQAEIARVALKDKNRGWLDEMTPASRDGEWAWVKNENLLKWQDSSTLIPDYSSDSSYEI